MKYRKYIMFAWAEYEALGGLYDIEDSFDTFEEAKKKAFELKDDYTKYHCECGQIVDSETFDIVFKWN